MVEQLFESDHNMCFIIMKMCCGVPQRSILGPKLFILFKNGKCIKFIIFAYDTNLFCTSKDIVSLNVTICNELMKLEK